MGNKLSVLDQQPLVPEERQESMQSIAELKAVDAMATGGGAGLSVSIPFTKTFEFYMEAIGGGGKQLQENTYLSKQDKQWASMEFLSAEFGFHWPGESMFLKESVQLCDRCLNAKTLNAPHRAPIWTIVYFKPMELVCVKFWDWTYRKVVLLVFWSLKILLLYILVFLSSFLAIRVGI